MKSKYLIQVICGMCGVMLILTGCSTDLNKSKSSNDTGSNLSVLQTALQTANQQKYTQITESGTADYGSDSQGTNMEINQVMKTTVYSGNTMDALLEQSDAPAIYQIGTNIWFSVAGKWFKRPLTEAASIYTNHQPPLSSITTTNLHNYFDTFSVKNTDGARVFTLIPTSDYQLQFFEIMSKVLHRVILNEDPYQWTVSVQQFGSSIFTFNKEQLILTVTHQNGAWIPTSATWSLGYSDAGNNARDVQITETYSHAPYNVLLPSTVRVGSQVIAPTLNVTHPDGQVISLTPLNAPELKVLSSLQVYKMMYWSDNLPVEAYVAVPKASGDYPIYVQCHGGIIGLLPVTHQVSPGGNAVLSGAPANAITVVPEYRGYADSDGTVSNIAENATDVNNAITAVQSKFRAESRHIYLDGVSMGGGVALKVASERSDVRSVIAVSPYVGSNIFVGWVQKHYSIANMNAIGIYQDFTALYGKYSPNSPVYQKESIDYKLIQAPTLLLQGTADQEIQWQTVQTLFNDMKAAGKPVELKLVPNADHAFTGAYASEEQSAINLWYAKYGRN